jgi:hypothetical protein
VLRRRAIAVDAQLFAVSVYCRPQSAISLANSQDVTDVSYYLEKLPDGYGLFETDRTSGEGQSYKRLFGHPSGKYYDSAKRFGVHFKWLMGRMEGDCECVLCSSKKPPAVRRSETFRLDSKTVSRPGSRTQSRELHVLQRERSSTFLTWGS